MKREVKKTSVNLIMLKQVIMIKRIKRMDIAKALDITYLTLHRKLSGETEFTLWEAKALSKLLMLSRVERDCIFFGDLGI